MAGQTKLEKQSMVIFSMLPTSIAGQKCKDQGMDAR